MKTAPLHSRVSRRLRVLLPLLFLVAIPVTAEARSLQDNVLGLRLGMSQQEIHRRLEKIGTLDREVRGRQEVWMLKNEPRFASVLVGFDRDYRVRYITGIAREGGTRMRYSEVAAIKDAHAESANGAYTRYTWEAKPGKKSAGYFLIAEGRDPEYLRSVSIKRHN